MNKALAVATGIGIGSGLMFLLDPDRGRRRRALVRDKAVRAYTVSRDTVGKTSRDIGNRARGVASEARGVFRRSSEPYVSEERERARHYKFPLMQSNWSPAWRTIASAGGGALAFYGMKRGGPVGAAASAAGISMLTRGISNREATRLFGLVKRAA